MLARYRGTLLAPYWRFRPTEFYNDVYCNGTFTADIMGCLAADQLVWTQDGLRPIGDVNVGDAVIGVDGLRDFVADKRTLHGESMVKITTGIDRVGVRMTTDHPCLVVRKEDARELAHLGTEAIRTNGGRRNYLRLHPARDRVAPALISVMPAESLKPGDYWLYPVAAERTDGPAEDLAWLYGMYLAEGWVQASPDVRSGFSAVGFSLHIEEQAFAERIERIIQERWGFATWRSEKHDKHQMDVVCSRTSLATALHDKWGKGAEAKRIPAVVLRWPIESQAALLDGYRDGDGSKVESYAPKNGSPRITRQASTVSPALAFGLLGVSIAARQPASVSQLDWPRRRPRFTLTWWKDETARGFYSPIEGEPAEFLWTPIRNVEEAATGAVVDLQIERTETFLTTSAITHNCNWTCEHCWSKYGWHGALMAVADAGQDPEEEPGEGAGPRYELTPAQAADKLIQGMKRNAQSMSRISGGEPTMHWDHTYALIGEFLERTQGLRFHLPPVTDLHGDAMGIIIESNGVMVTPDRLDQIEKEFGEESKRLVVSLGFKATHPEALADLTGMTPKVAERAHQRQLDSLFHLVLNCEHIVPTVSFLDRYTDPGIFAALQREAERARPGIGRNFVIQPFKNYGRTNSLWSPKRFRGKVFPEPGPERDEEIITQFIDEDGSTTSMQERLVELQEELAGEENPRIKDDIEADILEVIDTIPATEPVPVQELDLEDEVAGVQLEFAEAVKDLPEGRMRKEDE